MTREEVAEVMTYCKDNGKTYKARLAELGIPEWRFFESKARYAREQEKETGKAGEFIQLTAGGGLVPTPSFAATTGRKPKGSKEPSSRMLSIELRTPNGTMMRIQGEVSRELIQGIIQASSGRV